MVKVEGKITVEELREGKMKQFAKAVIEAYKAGGGSEEEAEEYFRKNYT